MLYTLLNVGRELNVSGGINFRLSEMIRQVKHFFQYFYSR